MIVSLNSQRADWVTPPQSINYGQNALIKLIGGRGAEAQTGGLKHTQSWSSSCCGLLIFLNHLNPLLTVLLTLWETAWWLHTTNRFDSSRHNLDPAADERTQRQMTLPGDAPQARMLRWC